MKVRPRKLRAEDKKKYMKALDALYTVVAELTDREQVKRFLKDLLTESERLMVGRRILIAQKLLRDMPYQQIAAEMGGVGMDTIMRVHRWLLDEEIGMEKIISKLENSLAVRKSLRSEGMTDPFSLAGIKKRYPGHYLFSKLINKE